MRQNHRPRNKGVHDRKAQPSKSQIHRYEKVRLDDVRLDQASRQHIAAKLASVFENDLSALEEQIHLSEPISLIAGFSVMYMTTRANATKPISEHIRLTSDKIELVQALALRSHFRSEPHPSFEGPDTVAALADSVSSSFALKPVYEAPHDLTDAEWAQLRSIETVRTDTQQIRNWGYPDQMLRIVRHLFRPISVDMKRAYGVNGDDLIDGIEALLRTHSDRMTRLLRGMATVQDARSSGAARLAFLQAMDQVVGTHSKESEMGDNDPRKNLSQFSKQSLVRMIAGLIPHTYRFSSNDLRRSFGTSLENESLNHIMSRWSLCPGELSSLAPDRLLLDNPVWRSPFIRLSDTEFYCPLLGSVISFCMEMIELLISDNVKLTESYHAGRARALESATADLFRSAFPGCRVLQGSQWTAGTTGEMQNFENDIAVVYDSLLVVVECKSSRVHPSARRGGVKRLSRVLRDLILEPSIQSERFVAKVMSENRIHEFKLRDGTIETIDATEVRHVVRLNVNMEAVGTLTYRWPELQAAGLLPAGAPLTTTMTLADLESVFDVLERPAERVHYLLRRTQLEASTHYFGDELDLLAFYVDTGFAIGDTEGDDETLLMIYGMSEEIEMFLMRSWLGTSPKRPRRRFTRYWSNLLDYVACRQSPAWLDSSLVLLNAHVEAQQELEMMKNKVKAMARAPRADKSHPPGFFLPLGPSSLRSTIVLLGYREAVSHQRRTLVEHLPDEISAEVSGRDPLILGFDADRNDEPYTISAFVRRKEKTSATELREE